METRDILLQARALISTEDHYLRHGYATDFDFHRVSPKDPTAYRWCAVGALMAVAPSEKERVEAENLLRTTILDMPDELAWNVVQYNAYHSHQEMLHLFDTTIEAIR